MQVNAAPNAIPEITAPAKVKAETVEKPKAEPPPKEKTTTAERPSENLEKLKTALAEQDISLEYSRDDRTNQLVVKMVDGKTGEAVRQIPSEVSLKLAAEFVKLQGVFVDKQITE